MGKHTAGDLYQMQSLPLSAKIQMTERRIREWVGYYGSDGIYIGFSGGKDSTVLLDISRKIFPGIPAVFVDTGLEYKEVRDFARQQENVEILRPKMSFRQVIQKYGYPFIGKEVAGCVHGARRYIRKLAAQGGGTVRYRTTATWQTLLELTAGRIRKMNCTGGWHVAKYRLRISKRRHAT